MILIHAQQTATNDQAPHLHAARGAKRRQNGCMTRKSIAKMPEITMGCAVCRASYFLDVDNFEESPLKWSGQKILAPLQDRAIWVDFDKTARGEIGPRYWGHR